MATARLVMTRSDEIQGRLEQVLRETDATAEEGCSALANALLAAFVRLKKQPNAAAVAEEMRRFAAEVVKLSALEGDAADRGLADATRH